MEGRFAGGAGGGVCSVAPGTLGDWTVTSFEASAHWTTLWATTHLKFWPDALKQAPELVLF